MVSKLVTTIAKKAGGKAFDKAIEKASDTYDYVKDRVRWGIKPLNIGEEETLACYKKYPNDEARCRALGDKIRDDYHHPGVLKNKLEKGDIIWCCFFYFY